MIIGRAFAIGHIPKTAGDAVHAWCRAINDQDLVIDDTIPGNGKHETFTQRSESRGKRFYALGIRRLPEWTASLMHEDARNKQLASDWGFQDPEQLRQPGAAIHQPYADWHLARMRQGVIVTHWIRSGPTALDDLIEFLTEVYRPLRQAEIDAMRAVVVKPPRSYSHVIESRWSRQELETMYRLNPQWAAIEALTYGGMW